MKSFLSFLTLFTSTGTLICCALPALFVSLGMGASLVGLLSDFPQLIWISEHKVLVFGSAFVLLAISGGLQWRARNEPCPIDPDLARSCARTRKVSFGIYLFSVAVFLIGTFFAFLA